MSNLASPPYRLYISPCPNDTFIFEALIQGQVSGFPAGSIIPEFADIQTLNQLALHAQADIIKVSCGLMHKLTHNYQLLHTGAALGFGVGPLLICHHSWHSLAPHETLNIAIPGEHTTANLLFDLYRQHQSSSSSSSSAKIRSSQTIAKHFIPFAEIAPKVAQELYHAGILIHEERFTYQHYQLQCLADLGEFWEQQFQLPIPLGCIMVHRKIPEPEQLRLENAIAHSLQLAQAKLPHISAFVRQHAQSMHPEIIRKHIDLYVNAYSLRLDKPAEKAIELMLKLAQNA